MYLCLFAKCISTNCNNIFVLICRRYLYFLQKVFALVCKKYFPFSREASCMLCNAGCQDLPCGKTSESRDCLFDTLTPSFPPELWYKKLFEYITLVTALNIRYYPEGSKNITPLELYFLSLLLKQHFQLPFNNFSHVDSQF